MWKNGPQKLRSDHSLRSRQGSVMVEFLVVFPLFLLLAMFTIEISLSWVDRHIMKLAAYEAARIYIAAPETDWTDGTPQTDPCLFESTAAKAKQAALRKMAIITPPISYFGRRLTNNSNLNFGGSIPGIDQLPSALVRVLTRWPTAAISTSVDCTYNANTKTVSVKITYARAPQTPFVGPVIWAAYILAKVNPVNGNPIATLNNVFREVSAIDTQSALEPLRLQVAAALDTAENIGMNINQTANILNSIPGIEAIFGTIPQVPTEIISQTQGTMESISNQIKATVGAESEVLTALVFGTPEALRRIPMSVTVDVSTIFSDRAELVENQDGSKKIREPRWEGRIKGIILLKDDYRTWAQHMSINQDGVIAEGESL